MRYALLCFARSAAVLAVLALPACQAQRHHYDVAPPTGEGAVAILTAAYAAHDLRAAPVRAVEQTAVLRPLTPPSAEPQSPPIPTPSTGAVPPGPTPPAATTPVASVDLPAPPQPQAPPSLGVRSVFFAVHLASYRSELEAEQGWTSIQAQSDGVLDALRPRVERADLGADGVFFRLKAGPLTGRIEAEAVCGELRAGGLYCEPADFTGFDLSSPANQ